MNIYLAIFFTKKIIQAQQTYQHQMNTNNQFISKTRYPECVGTASNKLETVACLLSSSNGHLGAINQADNDLWCRWTVDDIQ
jgi:hypothetical protein